MKTSYSGIIAEAGMPRMAAAGLSLCLGVWAAVLGMRPAGVAPNAAEALRRDSSNGLRWVEMAESLAAGGKPAEAQQAFDRALELSPGIPEVWFRYSKYSSQAGAELETVRAAAKVMAITADYDAKVLPLLDWASKRPGAVLEEIGGDRRATRAWLTHQMSPGDVRYHPPAAVVATWGRVVEAGFGDDELAAAYFAYLLRLQEFRRAHQMRATWLGKRGGEYPGRNLLVNGSFAAEPVAEPLDWRIGSVSRQFETVRENRAVRIQFFGTGNVRYEHLSQAAILPQAGYYRLTMRIKTAGITTNEGLRLEIPELGLASEPVCHTNDWMTVSLDFAVNQAQAIRVAVVRRMSRKFDNKIEGSAWISGMRLWDLGAR